MDIHKKYLIYRKLKTSNPEDINSDIALLKTKNPGSKVLELSSLDMIRKGQEVLWELLDFSNLEEINAARLSVPCVISEDKTPQKKDNDEKTGFSFRELFKKKVKEKNIQT